MPTRNFYGLTNISVECAYVNANDQEVLQEFLPGQALPSGTGVAYYQTAQPVFTNLGYYFARPNTGPLAGTKRICPDKCDAH